jgi:hypothetical protein
MTLKELIQTILKSDSSDWNEISCWGAFSGPSYKDKFAFYNVYEGEPNILHVDSHHTIAAYKNNLSITLAYGLTSNDEFIEEWANQFPNPSASSHFIDLFYNNSLVFRETYLVVDGGRCKLPIPSYGVDQELVVAQEYYNFIKLIQRLSSGASSDQNFESYFNRTGIKIIESSWIS